MRKSWLTASVLTAAAWIAGAVSIGSEARAGLLAWNNTGSSLSNCVNVTGTPCGTNTGTSLGLSTFLLNINPITNSGITVPPATTTGTLTQLQLTTANNPSGSATFNYNIAVNFTTPAGNTFTDTLAVGMTATTNNPNSTETLTGFSPLPGSFTIPGFFTLSNLHFVSNGTGGVLTGGSWTVTGGNGGNQTSPTLALVADVTALSPVATPEPGSLGLLGIALAGLGLVRRRRNSAA